MSDQKFLHDLEKKLWTAADKLRSTLDAAQYKHAVLGLLFVKYVSDAFDIRRQELIVQFQNEKHDYYLNPADFSSPEEYQAEIAAELEIRDYYTEKNVFWVPQLARWQYGRPPTGNANFAWLQHMLYHLAPMAPWACCWPTAP